MEIKHKGLLLGVKRKGMPGLPTYREETHELARRRHAGPLYRRAD